MKTAPRRRHFATITAAGLIGVLLAGVGTATPAMGADAADGPPQIFYTTPQIARPAGGTPIRIVGTGFVGTASVTFGNGAGQSAPALDFKVIDSTLITATVPSQAAVGAVDGNCDNWGFVGIKGVCSSIRISDNEGTGKGTPYNANGMFFTDATLAISPQPVAPGKDFTATLTDYAPNAGGAVVEMNPLVGFLEGDASCATANHPCPPDFTSDYRGPPPYISLLGFTNTGPSGNFIDCGGPCQPSATFNHVEPAQPGLISGPEEDQPGYGYKYDNNISCPPTQESADHGLGQCMIGFGQYARGTIERHVDFGKVNPDGTVASTQPVPAAPTLALSSSSAAPGDTVDVSGVHWNNNPYFGSDTTPDDPGETPLNIALCNSDGITNCVPVPAAAANVELTRYKTTSTSYTAPTYGCTQDPVTGNFGYPCTVTGGQPIQGVFSGTNLQGSFIVPKGVGCAPSCVVRVSQEGYDYDAYNGEGTGSYISAAAPLDVTSAPPGGPSCAGMQATIVGTPGADRLTGTNGPDVIVGLGGDDKIDGGQGDDTICTGAGNDTIDGGAGNDRIYGGAGDDRLVGSSGRDELRGGEGVDTLVGGSGNDQLIGGPDADTCSGGTGSNTFDGCETKTPAPPPGPADGNLDPSFGGDGKVVSDFGSDDSAQGVAVQPDGRIVTAGTSCGGDFLVSRYNPDGSLDATFDGDGWECIDLGNGSEDGAEEVLLLGDGRIVVAGTSGGDFALIRLNADGSLDPTFGTGGKATYDFGSTDRLHDAALAPDGKLVLVGETTVPGCPSGVVTPGQTAGVAVARTTAEGALDPAFGTDGKVVVASAEQVRRGLATVVQGDGSVVIAGRFASCSRVVISILVLRLTPSGAADPSFDENAIAARIEGPSSAEDIALQDDGKVVVAIDTFVGPATGPDRDDALTVARYNPDGSLDTSFGGDGLATTLFGVGTNATARAVTVQGEKVVVGGSVDGDFALARFNADGSADATFGGDGKVVTDFGGNDALAALAVQADTKVVAAGRTGSEVALARYG